MLMGVVYLAFQTYFFVLKRGDYPPYKWAWILYIISQSILIVHYLLARKYQFAALIYSNVQLINCVVMIIEMSIVANPKMETTDGFSI